MAGLINWKKVSIGSSNPDSDHVHVGVDLSDGLLYIKNSSGVVTKLTTTSSVNSYIAAALVDYDLSTEVDSKISAAITSLINGAPAALDTLNELAAALDDDANFASTVASNIATVQSDIDTHEANTSNPHSTTKAQVGLGNVDNTSDANKPVSTAQATAIASAIITHESSSDPHPQYETSTQLNTRDTNNRDRANHTGSQLSATISDFADTVRSTVLTGLSTATNAVITATDTVLIALGKLQAQLTQAISDVNATFSVVNGRLDVLEATDAEWIELIKTSADQLTGSNSTLQNVTDLQFTATAGRTYYLEYTIVFRTAATTTGLAITVGTSNGAAGSLAAQVNIPIVADGTAALFTGNITALGDVVTATGVQTAATNNIATMRGVFICTTGGVIVPQFRSEVNGSNAVVAIGSVALVRIF